MENSNYLQLIELFVQSAESTSATVERVYPDEVSLNEALVKNTVEEKEVMLSLPVDLSNELFSLFLNNPKVITEPTKEQLVNIKTGITDAFCGVASTGSVCVPVINNLSSPVSMLTRKHIVVLDAGTIVSKPRDVFSEKYNNGKGLSRSFSFITGPSATADMGPLVRGVHGPGKLHIIVLEK